MEIGNAKDGIKGGLCQRGSVNRRGGGSLIAYPVE